MNGSPYQRILLDPNNLNKTAQQLATILLLSSEEITTLTHIIELYPRVSHMYFDPTHAEIYSNLPLADKFTFDVEADELILFDQDIETLTDALIEMAMYLCGFTTKMGNEEAWVIEFAIGSWKPVKRRIKRQMGILINEQPKLLVGLRPNPSESPEGDPYPFRTLVSYFDQLSFHQMIRLAARDDVTVYFPPGTHPKVRAVYMHAQRAIEEVAQYITLQDHQVFNLKLNNAIQRIELLFDPSNIEPPNWVSRLVNDESSTAQTLSTLPPTETEPENPFEAFIEQLFSDEDNEDML